jgi:hypothetical protein
MPEMKLPEVKLPDIKLPEGFREMSRDDIVQAAKDVRLPKMEMPKRVEMPDIDLTKVDLTKVDLSKLELPKALADRLPRRKRTNRILPVAAFLAVGAAIAAAWYLITSPVTGPRIKHAFYDLKSRVTGEPNDVIRYDDEQDLGSLLTNGGDATRSSMTSDPYQSSADVPDMGSGVSVGPGETPEGIRP